MLVKMYLLVWFWKRDILKVSNFLLVNSRAISQYRKQEIVIFKEIYKSGINPIFSQKLLCGQFLSWHSADLFRMVVFKEHLSLSWNKPKHLFGWSLESVLVVARVKQGKGLHKRARRNWPRKLEFLNSYPSLVVKRTQRRVQIKKMHFKI